MSPYAHVRQAIRRMQRHPDGKLTRIKRKLLRLKPRKGNDG
jgi:hypothetical protein